MLLVHICILELQAGPNWKKGGGLDPAKIIGDTKKGRKTKRLVSKTNNPQGEIQGGLFFVSKFSAKLWL